MGKDDKLKALELALIQIEKDFGKEIPIQLSTVVRRVIMNKRISNDAADRVRTLCNQYCPAAFVERSSL